MSRALTLVACFALVERAHADPRAEAAKLFAEGRALVEQKRYAQACALFARSYELDAGPGTALNLADCAERDGKLREAWRLYDAAAREYERTNKLVQAKFARDRAAAVEPKLAIVVVRIAEPARAGLVVTVGGRAVAPAPEIVERLDAGPVEVTVRAPGAAPFAITADGVVGRHTIVEVPALAAVAAAPAPRDAGSPVAHTRRQRSRVYVAAGVGAAGAIAIVASGVVGMRAVGTYDAAFAPDGSCVDNAGDVVCGREADAEAVRRAGRQADLATIIGIGGGALLVAGTVVFLTAPKETVHVAPTVTASGGGISISGTF